MFGQTFTHDLIRKYVVLFGTMFDNLYLVRTDSNDVPVQTLKVPLTYAPKEKMLARIKGDPSLDNSVAMVLPHMGFEIVNYQYDSSRKLNTMEKIIKRTESGNSKYVYNPVPYDIIFQLHIMVKNAADGTRIVEQILPYFTPEFTVTANILPDIGKFYDIPITLLDTTVVDTYENNFETRRALVWTLTFAMKAYLFGPIRNTKMIRFVNTGITVVSDISNTSVDRSVTITSQPGQLANGEATSNIELTIPYTDVNPNLDYNYINTFDEDI